jgi:hypothetical protein
MHFFVDFSIPICFFKDKILKNNRFPKARLRTSKKDAKKKHTQAKKPTCESRPRSRPSKKPSLSRRAISTPMRSSTLFDLLISSVLLLLLVPSTAQTCQRTVWANLAGSDTTDPSWQRVLEVAQRPGITVQALFSFDSINNQTTNAVNLGNTMAPLIAAGVKFYGYGSIRWMDHTARHLELLRMTGATGLASWQFLARPSDIPQSASPEFEIISIEFSGVHAALTFPPNISRTIQYGPQDDNMDSVIANADAVHGMYVTPVKDEDDFCERVVKPLARKAKAAGKTEIGRDIIVGATGGNVPADTSNYVFTAVGDLWPQLAVADVCGGLWCDFSKLDAKGGDDDGDDELLGGMLVPVVAGGGGVVVLGIVLGLLVWKAKKRRERRVGSRTNSGVFFCFFFFFVLLGVVFCGLLTFFPENTVLKRARRVLIR